MTKTLVYSSSNDEPLVKNSGGNYQVSSMFVGSRITIQPDNLTPRRQYLANATGKITAIKGNKASVLLDEPSNKSYKSQTIKIDLCSLILIYSQESEDFRLQQKELEESGQLNLLNLIQMPNESCNRASVESPSTQTSEIIPPELENLTSCAWDSPVPVQASLEMDQDLTTQNQACGLKPCAALPTASPTLSSSKILQGLSIEDYEQFLEDCEWSDIVGTIRKSYQQRKLERPSKEKDYSSLPTPTTYAKGSTGCRPAGATRLEQKLRPFITKGDKLNPAVPGWMMGFPVGWVEEILMDGGETISVQLPFTQEYVTTLINDDNVTTSTPDPSVPDLQRSPLEESCTSTRSSFKAISLWQPWASLISLRIKNYETTACSTNYRGKLLICSTVNNPKHYREYLKIQDELQLPAWDEANFPHGLCVAICDLVDCIQITPELIAQQLQTEILCGDWQVGRYAWKLENIQPITEPFAVKGKQGLFNISVDTSQILLQPVKKSLLGNIENSPSNNRPELSELSPSNNSPSKLLGDIKNSPSKVDFSPSNNSPSKKRGRGFGNGYIHWRTITKNGKDYPQAYYHWKENGNKRSKYIPKKLLGVIQEASDEKRPVIEILELLGVAVSPSNLLGDIEVNPSNIEVLGDIEISPSNLENSPSKANFSPSNDPSNNSGDIKNSPSKVDFSPSKTRRHKGEGSGSIHWRTINKGGKDFPQAYYHYEFWNEGDRLTKSTKYIPKRLLGRVQELEAKKAPVREILAVLGVKL